MKNDLKQQNRPLWTRFSPKIAIFKIFQKNIVRFVVKRVIFIGNCSTIYSTTKFEKGCKQNSVN
ncbi:hypothetical protein [Fibrobacter sp.]